MSTKKQKPKAFCGDYWCGFSDGKPFGFPESLTREPVITISKNRRQIAKHYQDVRLIRITEIFK